MEPMEPAYERAAHVKTRAKAAISRPAASHKRPKHPSASPARPSTPEAAILSHAHPLLLCWSRGRMAARWSLHESKRNAFLRAAYRASCALPRVMRAPYALLARHAKLQHQRPPWYSLLTCCSSLWALPRPWSNEVKRGQTQPKGVLFAPSRVACAPKMTQ